MVAERVGRNPAKESLVVAGALRKNPDMPGWHRVIGKVPKKSNRGRISIKLTMRDPERADRQRRPYRPVLLRGAPIVSLMPQQAKVGPAPFAVMLAALLVRGGRKPATMMAVNAAITIGLAIVEGGAAGERPAEAPGRSEP